MTHRNTPNSPWTDERINQLKVWYAEGLSAGTIAAQLGGVSRNAVCGKIDRLKLTRDYQIATRRGSVKSRAELRQIRCHVAKPKPLAADAPRIKPEPFVCAPAEDAEPPLHKSLIELTDSMCHYPFGDHDFTFCGHPVAVDSSYCGPHARLCWRATR